MAAHRQEKEIDLERRDVQSFVFRRWFRVSAAELTGSDAARAAVVHRTNRDRRRSGAEGRTPQIDLRYSSQTAGSVTVRRSHGTRRRKGSETNHLGDLSRSISRRITCPLRSVPCPRGCRGMVMDHRIWPSSSRCSSARPLSAQRFKNLRIVRRAEIHLPRALCSTLPSCITSWMSPSSSIFDSDDSAIGRHPESMPITSTS